MNTRPASDPSTGMRAAAQVLRHPAPTLTAMVSSVRVVLSVGAQHEDQVGVGDLLGPLGDQPQRVAAAVRLGGEQLRG